MPSNPTILLVPGSFAPPHIYKTVIQHLRDAGFEAVALQLPSTVKRMPLPPANMSDDADVIRRSVELVIGQGKDVVVICHSYGGTPTTQALAGLKVNGKGVKRLIYLSAIVPKVGQSQAQSMGGEEELPPMDAVEGYLHIDATAMAGAVCNDLSWDLAYENALNFSHHSAASFVESVTAAAYTEVPVSYIFCERDLIVSPEKQEGFIKVVEEASGKKVDVVRLDCGHCPNWSIPEKLAEVVGELAVKG